MENIKIIENFEREINKLDDVVNKPNTEDSLFWLNQAIVKFVKLRFNGDFVHYTGFEETEKRREDLIKLFKSHEVSFGVPNDDTNSNYDVYTVKYNTDVMFVLNEDVIITDTEDRNKMTTCVFECTRDSFMYRVNNSLTDFHYRNHRARPLRIRTKDGCELLTDKKYKIVKYVLGYLKTPKELDLENPYEEYPDFQDSTLFEIIKMAAQMYLENQGEERYKSLTQEVLTQE